MTGNSQVYFNEYWVREDKVTFKLAYIIYRVSINIFIYNILVIIPKKNRENKEKHSYDLPQGMKSQKCIEIARQINEISQAK